MKLDNHKSVWISLQLKQMFLFLNLKFLFVQIKDVQSRGAANTRWTSGDQTCDISYKIPSLRSDAFLDSKRGTNYFLVDFIDSRAEKASNCLKLIFLCRDITASSRSVFFFPSGAILHPG